MKREILRLGRRQLGDKLALLFVLGIFIFLFKRPSQEGDTQIVVRNAAGAMGCLASHKYWQCIEAGMYPLSQLIPATVLRFLGVSFDTVVDILAYFSLASFVSMLSIFLRGFWKRDRALALVSLFVLISGYDLKYVNSSFGEMLAAFSTCAFAAFTLWNWNSLVAAFFLFIAGLTKETALPFLIFIAIICLRPWSCKIDRKRIFSLAVSATTVILVTVVTNYFRFGTFYNIAYLQKRNFVPNLSIQASFFSAIWFSPNGGVALFWPSFFIVLIGTSARVLLKRKIFVEKTPLLGIWILITALTFGFSKWYAPLGWTAWGSRLILPWLPCVLLILLHNYGAEICGTLKRLAAKPKLYFCFTALLSVSAYPHFAVMLWSQVQNRLFEAAQISISCPIIEVDPSGFFKCEQAVMWPKHWSLRAVTVFPPELMLIAGILSGLLFYLAVKIRESLLAGAFSSTSSKPDSTTAKILVI